MQIGVIGAISDLLAGEKALRDSKERGNRSNEATPINHHAKLHHYIRRQFDLKIDNRTPFGLKLIDYKFTHNSDVRFGEITLPPNHYTFFTFDNEHLKPDGEPNFQGIIEFQLVDADEKITEDMSFQIYWKNSAKTDNECGHVWGEEAQSNPFLKHFAMDVPSDCNDDMCQLDWTLHYKK